MNVIQLTTLAVLGVFAASMPAAAQTAPHRPERPYRGLFGGGAGDAEQSLTFEAGAGGGYDDNVLADSIGSIGGTGTPLQARSGDFGQFNGDLTYALNRTRVRFAASLATASRFYPGLADGFLGSHSGAIGTSLQVAKGTRVSASHSTSYQPYQMLHLFPALFQPLPGEAITTSPDFATSSEEYVHHSSSVQLSQSLSSRTALAIDSGYGFSDFRGTERDFASVRGAGRLTVGLTRGLALRVGYGYTEGQYASGAAGRNVRGHNIDAGVDYNRALSFSRRTTLSFGTGSAAIVDRERTYYRITGNARLNREVGRTWNASLAYDRNVGFLETFSEPFFSDSLTVGMEGLVSRRVQFRSGAAASVGDVGLSGEENGFDTYMGTVGLNVGITRHLGVGLSYAYYRYSFQSGVSLPPGLSREMDRQSVQAHLTLWVPLIHRARRSDASR